MDRLAIEFISVLGLDPVRFVELAARLGVSRIGMALSPIVSLPERFAAWNLREDAAMLADVRRALDDNGVSVSVGEGFLLMPGAAASSLEADLDRMALLGAPHANLCLVEPDFARGAEQVAGLADLASARGMGVTLEYLPGLALGDLAAARRMVEAVGKANVSILVDAMHFFRTGSTVADLAALPPALVGYAQICDVPQVPVIESYADEARYARLSPGEGELPLADFVRALPAGVTMGLEIPQRDKVLAGMSLEDILAPAIASARGLLN